MLKLKNLLAILVLISTVLFVGCQTEQSPVEPAQNQIGLNKLVIPAGATITSAKLFLNVQVANGEVVNLHRITSDWQEGVVTWSNFGSSFNAGVEGTFTNNTTGWISVSMLGLFNDWYNGTYPNFGVLLDQEIVHFGIAEFYTKESAFIPYLEVKYTVNGVETTDTTRSIADTFIWQSHPLANYGAFTTMNTGWVDDSNSEKQALVRFDIEQGPPPPEEQCETAYAFGGSVATCFLNLSPISANNWGWTNNIGPGTYDWPIYAGAGQCDISKGTLVGNLHVVYSGGTVTITYQMDPGFTLGDTHVWVGSDPLPTKKGKYVTAPGQFNHNGVNPVVVSGLSGNIWIAAHAGVCWMVE